MGGPRMSADDWDSYHTTHIAGKATDTVYSSRSIAPTLDPKGVAMREACDSDLSPESTAVIVGLDVTGSMSPVLDAAANNLGVLVQEIYNRKPVTDPHLMFMGIGDAEMGDYYPLQVTQFETDIRIAEQLTSIYFEKHGGGNSYESYILAWYFAALHTKIDCFEKRNKKGFLFTIGDEEVTPYLRAQDVERVLGERPQKDFTALELLEMVSKQYEVFHLMIEQGQHFRGDPDGVTNAWTKILGQRAMPVSDCSKIAEIIVSTLQVVSGEDKDKVVGSWDGSTSLVVSKAINGLVKSDSSPSEGGLVEF